MGDGEPVRPVLASWFAVMGPVTTDGGDPLAGGDGSVHSVDSVDSGVSSDSDDSGHDTREPTGGETDVDPFDCGPSQGYELDAGESPSTGVAIAADAVTGRAAHSIESLNETIDPDPLDGLVDPAGSRPVSVTFTDAGRTVTVDSTRRVLVHE